MNRIRVVCLTAVALLAVSAALPKTPADTGTICDRYQHNDLIFTGAAEHPWVTLLDTKQSPIHKRSEKSKRIRFLAREWFKGPRQSTVEVWMTPSDCDLVVETGQTYLIYARRNPQNGRMETNACMGSTAVGTAAADIAFLTATQWGPARATRISGTVGSEGVSIKATSGIDTRYAVSAGSGKFTFDGLPAGDWDVSVNGGAVHKLHLEPNSCIGIDLK